LNYVLENLITFLFLLRKISCMLICLFLKLVHWFFSLWRKLCSWKLIYYHIFFCETCCRWIISLRSLLYPDSCLQEIWYIFLFLLHKIGYILIFLFVKIVDWFSSPWNRFFSWSLLRADFCSWSLIFPLVKQVLFVEQMPRTKNQHGPCFMKKKPSCNKFHDEKYHDKLSFMKE